MKRIEKTAQRVADKAAALKTVEADVFNRQAETAEELRRLEDALKTVDKLPRDPVLITAFLSKDPASLLIRLKSSNRDIERGRAIGQWGQSDRYPDPKNPAAVRRWLSQVGESAADLLELRRDKLRVRL